METGPNAKFARRVSLQDSLLWFCYLQLTDTPGFRSPKPYWRFESLSLRHAVRTAEKFRCTLPENTQNMPVCRDNPPTKRTGRTDFSGGCRAILAVFLW